MSGLEFRRNIGLVIRRLAYGLGVTYRRRASDQDISQFFTQIRPQGITQSLIRLGSPTDGGYLVPDDLDGVKLAISPGVAEEVSFDVDIAERGIGVIMLDASVSGPPVTHPRFSFHPLFLDTYESDTTTSLESIIAKYGGGEADLLLQMDIEGAEYRVIHATSSDSLMRFRYILLEAHNLEGVAHPQYGPDIVSAINKLLQTHVVIHAHPNNAGGTFGSMKLPNTLELTLARKDRVELTGESAVVPHPLDRACAPTSPDITLTQWQ